MDKPILQQNKMGRYSAPARYLHWLMALLVFIQFCTIFYIFIRHDESALTLSVIHTHHACGMLVIALITVRFIIRLCIPPPPLPSNMYTQKQVWLAKAGHALLYCLLLMVPTSGYIILDATEFNAHFFNIPMPDILDAKEEVMHTAVFFHWLSAWLFGIIILGHVAMVLHHHLKGKRLLKRML